MNVSNLKEQLNIELVWILSLWNHYYCFLICLLHQIIKYVAIFLSFFLAKNFFFFFTVSQIDKNSNKSTLCLIPLILPTEYEICIQERGECGFLNALLAYNVHTRLLQPKTCTCTHSWKRLGAKCGTGAILANLALGFSVTALLWYIEKLGVIYFHVSKSMLPIHHYQFQVPDWSN